MGVPKLFKTLMNSNHDIFIDKAPKCDFFYLDFNCLMHYALRRCNVENENEGQHDEVVICEIIKYTRFIINDVVKPHQMVYIAIDGPVPNTKLHRQRERRFKKQFDMFYEHHIGMQYQSNQSVRTSFDSTKLTPGTNFMYKLNERIRSVINLNVFKVPTVIFSDCNEIGEGEWKIFNHIRNNVCDNIVIYGLDADLIVLCMSTRCLHSFLCREDDNDEIKFFDTMKCIDSLIIEHHLQDRNRDQVLQDLVLVLMLGGNDFVEAFEFTRIRNDGWNILIKEYSQEYYKLTCLTTTHINWIQFIRFLNNLSRHEYRCLKINQHKRNKQRRNDKPHNVTQAIELYNHGYLTNPNHMMHDEYSRQTINLNYSESSVIWKPCYYNDVINISYNFHEIRELCSDYLDSILWCWSYYINGVVSSWSYKYKYRAAPCLTDFVEMYTYIQNTQRTFMFDVSNGPLTPIAQLLCVLPRTSSYLLPDCLQSTVKSPSSVLCSQYPESERMVCMNLTTCMKMIYATPIIPPYNLVHIQYICDKKSCMFTEEEHHRNTLTV